MMAGCVPIFLYEVRKLASPAERAAWYKAGPSQSFNPAVAWLTAPLAGGGVKNRYPKQPARVTD
jgi:hypothetical protein